MAWITACRATARPWRAAHPGRNTQFEYINASVKQFQQRGQTVISVDTKKKEFVGAFKNGGREWQPKGEPEKVKVHDTARFAAEAIARWWKKMESKLYGDAKELLITADGGGSNGSRCRLWKVALQELATKLEMPVYVRHFPPGTSK